MADYRRDGELKPGDTVTTKDGESARVISITWAADWSCVLVVYLLARGTKKIFNLAPGEKLPVKLVSMFLGKSTSNLDITPTMKYFDKAKKLIDEQVVGSDILKNDLKELCELLSVEKDLNPESQTFLAKLREVLRKSKSKLTSASAKEDSTIESFISFLRKNIGTKLPGPPEIKVAQTVESDIVRQILSNSKTVAYNKAAPPTKTLVEKSGFWAFEKSAEARQTASYLSGGYTSILTGSKVYGAKTELSMSRVTANIKGVVSDVGNPKARFISVGLESPLTKGTVIGEVRAKATWPEPKDIRVPKISLTGDMETVKEGYSALVQSVVPNMQSRGMLSDLSMSTNPTREAAENTLSTLQTILQNKNSSPVQQRQAAMDIAKIRAWVSKSPEIPQAVKPQAFAVLSDIEGKASLDYQYADYLKRKESFYDRIANPSEYIKTDPYTFPEMYASFGKDTDLYRVTGQGPQAVSVMGTRTPLANTEMLFPEGYDPTTRGLNQRFSDSIVPLIEELQTKKSVIAGSFVPRDLPIADIGGRAVGLPAMAVGEDITAHIQSTKQVYKDILAGNAVDFFDIETVQNRSGAAEPYAISIQQTKWNGEQFVPSKDMQTFRLKVSDDAIANTQQALENGDVRRALFTLRGLGLSEGEFARENRNFISELEAVAERPAGLTAEELAASKYMKPSKELLEWTGGTLKQRVVKELQSGGGIDAVAQRLAESRIVAGHNIAFDIGVTRNLLSGTNYSNVLSPSNTQVYDTLTQANITTPLAEVSELTGEKSMGLGNLAKFVQAKYSGESGAKKEIANYLENATSFHNAATDVGVNIAEASYFMNEAKGKSLENVSKAYEIGDVIFGKANQYSQYYHQAFEVLGMTPEKNRLVLRHIATGNINVHSSAETEQGLAGFLENNFAKLQGETEQGIQPIITESEKSFKNVAKLTAETALAAEESHYRDLAAGEVRHLKTNVKAFATFKQRQELVTELERQGLFDFKSHIASLQQNPGAVVTPDINWGKAQSWFKQSGITDGDTVKNLARFVQEDLSDYKTARKFAYTRSWYKEEGINHTGMVSMLDYSMGEGELSRDEADVILGNYFKSFKASRDDSYFEKRAKVGMSVPSKDYVPVSFQGRDVDVSMVSVGSQTGRIKFTAGGNEYDFSVQDIRQGLRDAVQQAGRTEVISGIKARRPDLVSDTVRGLADELTSAEDILYTAKDAGVDAKADIDNLIESAYQSRWETLKEYTPPARPDTNIGEFDGRSFSREEWQKHVIQARAETEKIIADRLPKDTPLELIDLAATNDELTPEMKTEFYKNAGRGPFGLTARPNEITLADSLVKDGAVPLVHEGQAFLNRARSLVNIENLKGLGVGMAMAVGAYAAVRGVWKPDLEDETDGGDTTTNLHYSAPKQNYIIDIKAKGNIHPKEVSDIIHRSMVGTQGGAAAVTMDYKDQRDKINQTYISNLIDKFI